MSLTTVRFKTSLAGTRETRPGIIEGFEYHHDEVFPIDSEQAAVWISSGIAEPVTPSRNVEVERAMREPRSEQAMRLKRRRR